MPTNDDLVRAINQGDLEGVQACLKDPHVDPNTRNPEGSPVVGLTASLGHIYSLFVLLEAGANPNLTAPNQVSPLIAASAKGHLKIVKLLVHFGADITYRNSRHRTPREVAEYFKHDDVAEFLKAKEQALADAVESSSSVSNHETSGLHRRNVQQPTLDAHEDSTTNDAHTTTPSNCI